MILRFNIKEWLDAKLVYGSLDIPCYYIRVLIHAYCAFRTWRCFDFTCLTPFSDIYIGCYFVCCILVHMIFVFHHSSSWLVWRKVSKLERFLQEAKTLCFNRLQVHRNRLQQVVWSFKSWVLYWFNRLLLFHNRLHCSLRQWLIYSGVSALINYQVV